MSTPSEMVTSFGHDSRALAETYERLSDVQFESGKDLLERLGPVEGARVLDVGCGTGRLARWIAGLAGPAGTVVGIDPLPERVAIARTRARGIRFEVGRAEDLSAFGSESFDLVCMSSVLHWVTGKARALAEARRVLRPGGRVGVTTTSRELDACSTLHAILRSVVARAPYADRFRATESPVELPSQTTTDLISTVLDSGLELVDLRVAPQRWHQASGRELVDLLESSAFGNLLRAVPEDLRAGLRTDLAAAFDARKERDSVPVMTWKTRLVAWRRP